MIDRSVAALKQDRLVLECLALPRVSAGKRLCRGGAEMPAMTEELRNQRQQTVQPIQLKNAYTNPPSPALVMRRVY